jgi:hypothetical protein
MSISGTVIMTARSGIAVSAGSVLIRFAPPAQPVSYTAPQAWHPRRGEDAAFEGLGHLRGR